MREIDVPVDYKPDTSWIYEAEEKLRETVNKLLDENHFLRAEIRRLKRKKEAK